MHIESGTVSGNTPPEVVPTAKVAYFATYWDLYWLLDDQRFEYSMQWRVR